MTDANKKPLISAVMPVYNCASYIREAVVSVLSQTEKDFELLIMDDCSIDDTLERIRDIRDSRIKIFKTDTNLGQANQLNKGIKLAGGKFIAIVHGDDINLPTRFAEQLSAFDRNPEVDLLGTWIEYIGEKRGIWEGPVSTEECFAGLLMDSVLAHPTVMFKRDKLLNTGESYRQEFVPAEDYDLWVRLSPFCSFYNVPKVLLQYRVHPDQISAQKESLIRDKIDRIRENMVKYLFPNDDSTSLAFLKQLWDFKAGSRISFDMIRNISRLSRVLAGKGGVDRRTWEKCISNWVYNNFLITKNYDFGVGLLFLFSRPAYLLTKKKLTCCG